MTGNRRPQPALDDRELRLWKVGRALLVTFAAAILVTAGVFYGLVKLSFGVVAGAGAFVALASVGAVGALRGRRRLQRGDPAHPVVVTADTTAGPLGHAPGGQKAWSVVQDGQIGVEVAPVEGDVV
jgi:hypothetical protein